MVRVLFCAFLMTVLPLSTWADVSGDQDRRYQTAKREWLSGAHDLEVLRKLSALAASDNLAAQVTLGMIHIQWQTHNHVTKGLSRKERSAIFRKPNSHFGERWLNVAARSNPLAALLTARDVEDYEAHAMALAEAGLITRAIRSAYIPMNMGDQLGTIRALSHPNLLPYTKASVHWFAVRIENGLRLTNKSQEADEVLKLRMKLPPMAFKDRLLASDISDRIRYQDLPQAGNALRLRGTVLLHHPDLQPLTHVLRDVCPEDTGYHLGVLYHLRGGMELRRVLLGPLEPMISTDEWQKSERFRGDLLRNWHPGSPSFEILQNLSACFAKAVLAEM